MSLCMPHLHDQGGGGYNKTSGILHGHLLQWDPECTLSWTDEHPPNSGHNDDSLRPYLAEVLDQETILDKRAIEANEYEAYLKSFL